MPSPIHPFLYPRSVAVFGASERADTVGSVVIDNLLRSGFDGRVVAVNPKYPRVHGLPCGETLDEHVDLAVIATPAATVDSVVRQCGLHDVRAAVVMSAGFGEGGRDEERRRTLRETARASGVRIMGPNCLGIVSPRVHLNATFSRNVATTGHLALVSQSGAICSAMLDWAEPRGIGFSAVVSIGDAIDVGFADLLSHLALDRDTSGILLYVEGVTQGRAFMSSLQAAAQVKPVIVLKAGRHKTAARAVMSHTGALVGRDDVFDAVLQRAGAVRVGTIAQLFASATVLGSGRRVRGSRLGIVSNAGGPAIMAADRAGDLDIEVPQLSPATMNRLDGCLPPSWSHGNPVDVLGDADARRYGDGLGAVIEDPGIDAVLAILTPQAMTEPEAVARAVVEVAQGHSKPVLTCWMGDTHVREARRLFALHGIAQFEEPEAAVDALHSVSRHRHRQPAITHVPGPIPEPVRLDLAAAKTAIAQALGQGRSLLSPNEVRQVLRAFQIPITPVTLASDESAAVAAAARCGYPVALKVASPDVVHKSDVGGVALDVANEAGVRTAFAAIVERVLGALPGARIEGVTVEPMVTNANARELLVGIFKDEVFGPVVVFGAGGVAVEQLRDRAIALPPLNRDLARELVRGTRISALLDAYRNVPAADRAGVDSIVMRVAEMACELPEIQEMDINPIVASSDGVVAVDARIRVAPISATG